MKTKLLRIVALIFLAVFPIAGSAWYISTTYAQQEQLYLLRQHGGTQYIIVNPFYPGTEQHASWVNAAVNVLGRGTATRKLAVTCPVMSLDWTDADIKAQLADYFSTAEVNDVPLFIHLDTEHFFENRPDLWNWWNASNPGYNASNVDNVEWSNWSTPTKVGYLNWGSPMTLPPRLCYESPAVRAVIAAKDQVIVTEVKQWEANLTAEHKTDLFLGIDSGWETAVDDYQATSWVPAQDQVELGYNALTRRGCSAANPPSNLYNALVTVVQDIASFEAKTLVDLGIPRDEIFTHIWGAESPPSQPGFRMHAPMTVAFNNYSIPGFSLYSGYNAKTLASLVADKEWAVMETPPVNDYSQFLKLGFCKAIAIYNWGGGFASGPEKAVKTLLAQAVVNSPPNLLAWVMPLILYITVLGVACVLVVVKRRNAKNSRTVQVH